MLTEDEIRNVHQEFMNKPEMKHRFYRVYHLKNGEEVTMEGSPHLTYDDAVKHLWCFLQSPDMQLVDHVTIEKRFLPVGYDLESR